jgi:hypothetical protein
MALSEDDKIEISLMISDGIQRASMNLPGHTTVKANPEFDPKGKYEVLDKVRVEPTKGNIYHKDKYILEGHQATMQIRKGFCKFIEVVEKYVPKKPKGKILSKVEL